MKAAAVVLNYNLPELTDRLCADIIRRTECDFDLFVIENGSFADNLSKHCTHHLEKNRWISGGFNYGITQAMNAGDYDAIWCLFNDVEFDQSDGDVLAHLMDCLEAYPRIGIVQPAWGNEWIADPTYAEESTKTLHPGVMPVYATDPLCMLFRTEMIRDVTKSLGPNCHPLWEESNKRLHANAELIQLIGYRRGWATATTTVFTASELREQGDAHSEGARGQDIETWQSEGVIERERWIRRRWKDPSFFYSPNLLAMGNIRPLLRNTREYAKMWKDLSSSKTSGKDCWRHALRLSDRECQGFLLRYPAYAKMTIEARS